MAKTMTLVLAGLACCVSLARAGEDGKAGKRPGGCFPLETLRGKLIKARAPLGKPTMTLPADDPRPGMTVWRLRSDDEIHPLSFIGKDILKKAEGLVGQPVVVTGGQGRFEFAVWDIRADDTKELVGTLTKVVLWVSDMKWPPRGKPSPFPAWLLKTKDGLYSVTFAGKAVAAEAEKLAGKTVKVKGTLKSGTLHIAEIVAVELTKVTPAPAAPRKADKDLRPAKQWKGALPNKEDEPLKKLAPTSGYITDAAAWAKLWKAWKFEETLPAVDFKKQLVLVSVADGAGNSWVNVGLKLTAKGDLRATAGATEKDGPGFIYLIRVVSRDGVKTVNGKSIADK